MNEKLGVEHIAGLKWMLRHDYVHQMDRVWIVGVIKELEAQQQAEPCQGTNCGTTTCQHSDECIAETAISQGWDKYATHSEEGREVPEVVLRAVPQVKYIIHCGNLDSYDIEEVYPACEILKHGADLMTVAQHARILAGKDAEISRLSSDLSYFPPTVRALAETISELRAQPARQVGGERCQTCDGTGDVHGADGEWRGKCHCAALAPAAVVKDSRYFRISGSGGVRYIRKSPNLALLMPGDTMEEFHFEDQLPKLIGIPSFNQED